MATAHEVNSFLRDAREDGWLPDYTSRSIRLTHVRTGAIVHMPKTPGGSFWMKATRGQMKRALKAKARERYNARQKAMAV